VANLLWIPFHFLFPFTLFFIPFAAFLHQWRQLRCELPACLTQAHSVVLG
jgi:hypothetical protein